MSDPLYHFLSYAGTSKPFQEKIFQLSGISSFQAVSVFDAPSLHMLPAHTKGKFHAFRQFNLQCIFAASQPCSWYCSQFIHMHWPIDIASSHAPECSYFLVRSIVHMHYAAAYRHCLFAFYCTCTPSPSEVTAYF